MMPTKRPLSIATGEREGKRRLQEEQSGVLGRTADKFLVHSDGTVKTPDGKHVKGRFDRIPADLSDCYFHNDQLMRLSKRAGAGSESPQSLRAAQDSPVETQGDDAIFTAASNTDQGVKFPKRAKDAPAAATEGERQALKRLMEDCNRDALAPDKVLETLRDHRKYYQGQVDAGNQVEKSVHVAIMKDLFKPILNSENARNPGLNAMYVRNAKDLARVLKEYPAGKTPVHLRFHYEMEDHSLAVDAFRHGDGKFTLLGVDGYKMTLGPSYLDDVTLYADDLIAATDYRSVRTQTNITGCRTFAFNHLLAMHEYEPYFERLHQDLRKGGVASEDADMRDQFPPKFFKHLQGASYLTQWEQANPTLAPEWVNKQNKTQRERRSSTPEWTPTLFEKNQSLDEKRLTYIDRAIKAYEPKV